MTARSISRSIAGPFARSIVGRLTWTPTQLFAAGQQGVWLDTLPKYLYEDSAGTIEDVVNGDPVGRADDRSGNGNHLTQATSADRPTYGTDGALDWLAYDGAGDFLSNNFPSSDVSTGFFLAVAGNWNDLPDNAYLFSLGSSSSDTPVVGIRSNSASGSGLSLVYRTDDSTNNQPVGATQDTNKHVFTLRLLSGELEFRVDGVQVNNLPVSGSTTIDRIALGALLRSGAGFHANANVHAALFCLDNVTDTERDQVESYLADRAGITL